MVSDRKFPPVFQLKGIISKGLEPLFEKVLTINASSYWEQLFDSKTHQLTYQSPKKSTAQFSVLSTLALSQNIEKIRWAFRQLQMDPLSTEPMGLTHELRSVFWVITAGLTQFWTPQDQCLPAAVMQMPHPLDSQDYLDVRFQVSPTERYASEIQIIRKGQLVLKIEQKMIKLKSAVEKKNPGLPLPESVQLYFELFG
jgi:hypothetical protein